MDVRGKDYVREVSKYVVEGSELAAWAAEHVHEFVRAVKGRRFFFAFGSLAQFAPAIRATLRSDKPAQEPCECGATDWVWEDEVQAIVNEVRQMERRKRK